MRSETISKPEPRRDQQTSRRCSGARPTADRIGDVRLWRPPRCARPVPPRAHGRAGAPLPVARRPRTGRGVAGPWRRPRPAGPGRCVQFVVSEKPQPHPRRASPYGRKDHNVRRPSSHGPAAAFCTNRTRPRWLRAPVRRISRARTQGSNPTGPPAVPSAVIHLWVLVPFSPCVLLGIGIGIGIGDRWTRFPRDAFNNG